MNILLVTPPFTQLNTPYPATSYLAGFLRTKGINCTQRDFGIETINKIFSSEGLKEIFEEARKKPAAELSENIRLILQQEDAYLYTIDAVVAYLQGKNEWLTHRIAQRNFLPEAARFSQLHFMKDAFGVMGIHDRAKHFATLYLEDLGDLITECVDARFGFSRYGEKLGRCANNFDELYAALQEKETMIERIYLSILEEQVEEFEPEMVCFTVPFPGNLFSALRCAQWLKKNYRDVKTVMGGGFPSTELRSLKDPRVFEFMDYVCLDDGERPLEQVMLHAQDEIGTDDLVRTFLLENGSVAYKNNTSIPDYFLKDTVPEPLDNFFLENYMDTLEVLNPMHSLWSNGRWNKMMLAHGCYWGKCTFCDTTLDYISRYEPLTATEIVDRMEAMMENTEQSGFHFVDEAAPPALLKAMALELLKRKLVVSWWTNIRFEKSFTRELCMLLKASGCIGVSGGLEVASDRLLQLINKGVTVAQVARVNKHFTDAGIMVHAYLMYGFPTQTAQETIDSLEMVRQMFKAGILQSAYWHLFTMTAHSPVGMCPEKYKVSVAKKAVITFANNDVPHLDPTGADHESFSYGLKKSLHNYLHALCLDNPLHTWFDFKTPKPTVAEDFILKCLEEEELNSFKSTARIVFFGHLPHVEAFTKSKKGNQWEMLSLRFVYSKEQGEIKLPQAEGNWLLAQLKNLAQQKENFPTLQQIKDSYEQAGLEDFELFWFNKPMNGLWRFGLWML
jgi:hypothetical protein